MKVKTGPYVYTNDYSKVQYKHATKTNYEDVEHLEHFNRLIRNQGLTVCYFSKSTFNPCKYFEPIFKHISRELHDKAKFIRVDCDYPHLNRIAKSEDVRTFPSFTLYQHGLELVSIIGTNELRLRHLIKMYHDKENEIAFKKLRKIRSADEFEELIRQNRVVVANFYSTDCILCQRIMPDLEKINTDYYEKIDFVSVDCDDKETVSNNYVHTEHFPINLKFCHARTRAECFNMHARTRKLLISAEF